MKKPTICLNAIVKNESDKVERWLGALVDQLDTYCILDTGSTDDTVAKIQTFMEERGVPGKVHHGAFHDFAQARNDALALAQAHKFSRPVVADDSMTVSYDIVQPDWLFLVDADMVLRVEDKEWWKELASPAFDGYHVMQRVANGVMYPNVRLIKRGLEGTAYRCPTHEYLCYDSMRAGNLAGIWFEDYIDGANRVVKSERDIKLITEYLKDADEKHPDTARMYYYLGQSYMWDKQYEKAAVAYAKCAEISHWDEEAWSARMHEARNHLLSGNEGEFVLKALRAFNMRPSRAEPLRDLANYWRDKNRPEPARLFAEKALELPVPLNDKLFVETNVYTYLAAEEYYLAAFASPEEKVRDKGAKAREACGLGRHLPPEAREMARLNSIAFARALKSCCPSLQKRPLGWTPPKKLLDFPKGATTDGAWHLALPSIIRDGDGFAMTQRIVNYTIDLRGAFPTPNDEPILSREFFLRLDPYLNVVSAKEIVQPPDIPTCPRIPSVEDYRLFKQGDDYYAIGMAMNPDELCEQVLLKLDVETGHVSEWKILTSPEGRTEKNWGPILCDPPKIFYKADETTILDLNGKIVRQSTPAIAADNWCNNAQWIPFNDGWLGVVHEHTIHPETKWRCYVHRFAWMNDQFELKKWSRLWLFDHPEIEYVGGIAWKDERTLVISYHHNDDACWLATVNADEVWGMLNE